MADLMAMPPMRVRRISARWRCGRPAAAGAPAARRTEGSGDLPTAPGSPDYLAFGNALRPAKADFVEIEVGMLGADVGWAAGAAQPPSLEANATAEALRSIYDLNLSEDDHGTAAELGVPG
jgi:hypothetical protein